MTIKVTGEGMILSEHMTIVQTVRERLEQSPQKPTKRLSQEVSTSRMTVQRVIHNDLKLFPYKVQILQKQTDVNKEGVNFVRRIENNPGDLGLILFSEEAHFHLSRHVNK